MVIRQQSHKMEEKISISDQLAYSKFSYSFIKIIAPIISNHVTFFIENHTQNIDMDFDQFGTDKEIQLKKIHKYFGLLGTIMSDLEKVLIFLRIDNKRTKLQEIYPELESQKDYYIYHFENFIIRVTTITDIIGKLGNELYDTRLAKVNGYSFKEEMKKYDENVVIILEKLLNKTKVIKDRRHEKIHKGETEINYLEGIAFWDNIQKLIKEEVNPILEEYTKKSLLEAVNSVEIEIREIIVCINEFLDYSIPKLEAIVNR